MNYFGGVRLPLYYWAEPEDAGADGSFLAQGKLLTGLSRQWSQMNESHCDYCGVRNLDEERVKCKHCGAPLRRH